MNRKGFFIPAVAGAFLVMAIAAAIVRPSHVEQRYIEKCRTSGSTVSQCVVQMEPLDLEQRIDYIRDKATGPTTYNFTHR